MKTENIINAINFKRENIFDLSLQTRKWMLSNAKMHNPTTNSPLPVKPSQTHMVDSPSYPARE